MIYIFDFDNTLFQTEQIKQKLFATGEAHGLTPQEARDLYATARDTDGKIVFTLEHFFSLLDAKVQMTQTLGRWKESLLRDHMLVPGAIQLLTALKQRSAAMYLLSLGQPTWQEEKVSLSGIGAFFHRDHILYTTDMSEGKKVYIEDLIKKEQTEEVLLFNDKPDETEQLLASFPRLTAYVRRDRDDGRYTDADFIHIVDTFGSRVRVHDDLVPAVHII